MKKIKNAFRFLAKTSWPILIAFAVYLVLAVVNLVAGKGEVAFYLFMLAFWAAYAWLLDWQSFNSGYIRGQVDHAKQMLDRLSKPQRKPEVTIYKGAPMSLEEFDRIMKRPAGQ